jgi:hypothetical protein
MTPRGMTAAMLCAMFFGGTAAAQSNIGELLVTLHGATVAGKTAAGGETSSEFKDNGTVSGYVVNATGRRGSVFGTWTADDSGKLCRDVTIKFYESSQVKGCFRIYRIGDQYYVPATESEERGVAVLKRTITR